MAPVLPVAYRDAARLRPDDAGAHVALAAALKAHGELDAAIAEARDTIRLLPNNVAAHVTLGNYLKAQGRLDEAVAAYREAIRLAPDHAGAYSGLVAALKAQGKLDEAVAAYREAIRRKPDDALAHFQLAGVLRASGDAAGSLGILRKGHELNMAAVAKPNPARRVMYPSARWLEDVQKSPIYDPQADPNEQIATALARAKRANKHVILQFGGNWCDWCHKLLDVFLNN